MQSIGRPGIVRAHDLSVLRARKSATQNTDLNMIERGAIDRALRDVGGNKSKAGAGAGSRAIQVHGRLRKHRLETGGHDRLCA